MGAQAKPPLRIVHLSQRCCLQLSVPMGSGPFRSLPQPAEMGEPGKTLLSSKASESDKQVSPSSKISNAPQHDENSSRKNTAEDPSHEPAPTPNSVSEAKSDSNRQKLALILEGIFEGFFDASMPDVVDFVEDTHGALDHFHATAVNFD